MRRTYTAVWLVLWGLASVCADSGVLPPEVKETVKEAEYRFGASRIVLRYESTQDRQYPKYILKIYHGDQLAAVHENVGFEQVFADSENRFFVGVSNSGLVPQAYVIFDRQGRLLKQQPHHPRRVPYFKTSATLIREWYDPAKPEPRFVIKNGRLNDVRLRQRGGGASFSLLGLPAEGYRPPPETIRTELKFAQIRFRANEPMLVDVYVTNCTTNQIQEKQFSPRSSFHGPEFVFVQVPGGEDIELIPGGYSDDWDSWYQPASGEAAYAIGEFTLLPGRRIHLLHGDLRSAIARAGRYCQKRLEDTAMASGMEWSTKMNYQEMVRFAAAFLKGGTYEVSVNAYAKSPSVRITVEPPEQ